MKLLQIYRRKYTINGYINFKGSVYILICLRGVHLLAKSIIDYNHYHDLIERKELYAVTKTLPK